MFRQNTKFITRSIALGLVTLSGPAHAQSDTFVELQTIDGSALVSGSLIEFKNDVYIVSTEIGELRVSAGRAICDGPGCPEVASLSGDVVIAGSEALGESLLPLLLEGYANQFNAEASVTAGSVRGETLVETIADRGFGDDLTSYLIVSGRSESAFTALAENKADIGMSERRITREEAQRLNRAGVGNMVSPNNEHVVAVDNIVVIVHPNNPVARISTDNLVKLYSGSITNWSQLGGEDAPIEPLIYTNDPITQTVFEEALGTDVFGVRELSEDSEMAAAVNNNPNAIGFVGFAFQRGAKALEIENACGLVSSPSTFSAKAEEYPFNRRLFLYSPENSGSEDAEGFLKFAQSELADGMIAKAGFIDLSIERQEQAFLNERLRNTMLQTQDPFELSHMQDLAADMEMSDRLSTTIRFSTGSNRLDQKSLDDIARLISYIETIGADTEISVVGFTDSVGPFSNNLRLSEDRAVAVANTISSTAGERFEGTSINIRGYGEMSPVACNNTDSGRAINRRVEIWITQK